MTVITEKDAKLSRLLEALIFGVFWVVVGIIAYFAYKGITGGEPPNDFSIGLYLGMGIAYALDDYRESR